MALKCVAHDARPHAAGGAELGDLFQKIVVGIEEERKPRGEVVHIEARREGGLHVGDAVGQREGDFLHRGRAGFAHVIAGDGNRVPLGQFVRPRQTCR